MRAEGWGSLGSSLQALGRGDPGNSKGWSLTPKYPTPKLQFTHDLDGEGVVGGEHFKEQRKKEDILAACSCCD